MLMALWVFLVGLSLLCVTLTQSRAAWLALWPGLLLLLVLAIARIARSGAPLLQKSLHVPLLVVAVLGAFWLGGTTLQERFDEERANIERLLNLDLDSVRSGNEAGADFSIGTRLNMLKSGWQTWLEKPVFGSGPAAAKRTLAVHPDPILRRWNDYHNAVINILVCYGAVGLTLALGGVLETARLAWVAVRERAYGADTLLFLVLALAILVFSLLSNFRLLNFDWRYTLFLVAGALASPRLAQLASTRPSPTLPDHIKSGPIVK
jgi:O-antigen ligase